MKRLTQILSLVFFLSVNSLFSQTYTFSATTAFKHDGTEIGFPVAQNSWQAYQYVDIHVPVSGLIGNLTDSTLELLQINIHYSNSSNMSNTRIDAEIKSPLGSSFSQFLNGELSSQGYYQEVDLRLRDHATLNQPYKVNKNLEPFQVGYYRTYLENQFDNYVGEDPNGTWIIRLKSSYTYRPAVHKVELIFGVNKEVDITSETANNSCSAPQEFCNNKSFIYYNDGFSSNSSQDPGQPFDGCQWNNGLNNIGWFAFTASQTSAKIEISGIDPGETQQVIVVGNNTGDISCDVNDLFLVSGGCPKDAVNVIGSSNVYANGTDENIDLNLSGLTIGEIYYLVVDGEGGNVSETYLTMEYGADDCNTIPLPVELTNFSGKNINNLNKLVWRTNSEENNDYFTIERSTNAKEWSEIGTVYGAGNSSTTKDYQYVDNKIENKQYYYRLKQTDYDGTSTYFKIISIKSDIVSSIKISPNPVQDYISVVVDKDIPQGETIIILDITGKIIKQERIKDSKVKFEISNFPKGIYYVRIGENTEKFIKL